MYDTRCVCGIMGGACCVGVLGGSVRCFSASSHVFGIHADLVRTCVEHLATAGAHNHLMCLSYMLTEHAHAQTTWRLRACSSQLLALIASGDLLTQRARAKTTWRPRALISIS